jgi:hypothetical protein
MRLRILAGALLLVPLALIPAGQAAAATGSIVFDGSPGTGAPPSTLGSHSMSGFPADPSPVGSTVTGVSGPTGDVTFSPSLVHDKIGYSGWLTWSNGYTGDVYASSGGTLTITLPAGTQAFYFYAEPDSFGTVAFTATAQDGTSSGPVEVAGGAGARYFGFYATSASSPVTSITIAASGEFAVGEFGVATTGCVTSVPFGAYLATAEDGSCLTNTNGVYTDSKAVSLNGLNLVANGGEISIDTISGEESFRADDATVEIGSFPVYSGPIPDISLDRSWSISVDKSAVLGHIGIKGELDFSVNGTEGLTVTGTADLPEDLGGGSVSLSATMDAANGFTSAELQASDLTVNVRIQKITLKGFSLSYDVPDDTWTGTVTVGLPVSSNAEVTGEIVIAHGKVTKFAVSGDKLNEPLGDDGVFLQSIDADIVLSPSPSITGTASITAGPMIDGVAAISVSGSDSYGFGNPGYVREQGTVTLLSGTGFSQAINGELDYYTNGHITVSGNAGISLAGIALAKVVVSGWVDGTSAFSFTGTGSIGFAGLGLSGNAVISNVGIAACGDLLGYTAGFGYLWGGSVTIMGSSCGIGPYTAAGGSIVFDSAGTPVATITLPKGLPVASFKITGPKGGAPSGTLTDPTGDKIAVNPAHLGVFTTTTPEYALGADNVNGIDYLLIKRPAGGTWTFTPATGSSVTSIQSAKAIPAPSVKGTVSGTGLKRALSWHIANLSGQQVTFVEEANGVDRVLAANVSASSGQVSFTPADGPAGTRSIVAEVTQGGLTRQTIPVTSYTAPATATIAVTVQDSGKGTGVVKVAPANQSCSSNCSVAVPAGQKVTLSPAPATGSTFAWTGGLCTGTGPCTLTITGVTTVTGRFSA